VAVLDDRGTSGRGPERSTAPAEFDRQPPQDLPAEQSVLGAVLLSKDAIADVVEMLKPDDFYRPAHQTIYECVLDLYGRGEPADPVTISAELERRGELLRIGGAPYLHTLIATVPTAANAGYYAEIVADRAILRRLVEAGTRIVQLGYHGAEGADTDDVVDRAQAAVYEVTDRRVTEDYVALEDVLQPTMDEIDAIASRGGVSFGVPTGFTDLDDVTNGLHAGQMIIVAARPGIGKALALDTPLATPEGWTTMAEVAVGDRLLDATGRPTCVVAATEVLRGRPCYEVEFSDGTVIVADEQHQWLTDTRASRRSTRVPARVRTTAEIAATLRCPTAATSDPGSRVNHSVPVAAPLRLPERDLPVPPYALGVWLGDGTAGSASFTSADPEIAAHVEAEGLEAPLIGHLRHGLRLPADPPPAERACVVCGRAFRPATSQVRSCGRSCGGRARFLSAPVPSPTCADRGGPSCGLVRCQACRDHHGTVQARLRTLGVLGDKHIPVEYLRASEEQRRALLAGLLDTDGTVLPTGVVQLAVTDARLALGVAELVASLGLRCSTVTKRVHGRSEGPSTAFLVRFSTTQDVFRLERKRLAHKERRRATDDTRTRLRYVVDVRPVPSVPVRCVEVDNPDHLYLAGRSMVPTHNSTLGLDFARNASVKHGLTSVVFSLEMSRTEIVMRMLSAEAKIRLADMRAGTMTDDDWTRLARRMSEISEAPMFIDDSPNMTIMEIRAKARRLKQRHDLKLIILDYMQLMTSGKKVESRQQEVSEFSRQLKLLAKELEVPLVAISQLNRGPEQRTDKKPMLSDLRESGSLEQDADMVMLLSRPDAFERDDPRAGEADVILAKHRNGPTATITVAHQLHYSRFSDIARG
jgi:replicative DNA helicase